MQVEKARTVLRGNRDDLGALIRRLSDTLTARGQRSFRNAVMNAVSGDASLGWEDLTIHTKDLFSIYEQAYKRAGRAESAVLGQFDIDLRNPRVVRHLRDRSAGLITNIDDATKGAVRTVLSRGTASGLQPEQLANRIGRVVGLTPRDALAVENLRDGLLRQGINSARVDRMAKTYAKRLLDARALVIARTEVVDAIESARQEVWEQAVAAGLVLSKNIWRVWVTAEDERVCPICAPLDGAKSRLNGTFRKGGQSALRPPAHPNCRCHIAYEVAGLRVSKHGDGSHDEKDHGNWARGGAVPSKYPPGEAPIPDGTTRLYHYTGAVGVVETIASEGFKLSSAKGETYGEPNALWFSRRMPDIYAKEFVEVALPKEMTDRAIVGGIAYESSDISLGFDIGPEFIIGVHKPWHGHYRYMLENPSSLTDVRAGEFDSMIGDSEWGPAIEYVKLQKHYGPGPHPSGSSQLVHGGGEASGGPSTVITKDGVIDTDWSAAANEYWSNRSKKNPEGLVELQRMLDDADVWINVPPEILAQIARDGVLYTQRHTQTSGGTLNNGLRDQIEETLFGPSSMSDTYPVYGYMAENPANVSSAGSYGRAMIKLKPHVRENTTFTIGDSFGTGAPFWWDNMMSVDEGDYPVPDYEDIQAYMAGGDITTPSFINKATAGTADGDLGMLQNRSGMGSTIDTFKSAYTEAQIHQPIRLKDISAIYVREASDSVIYDSKGFSATETETVLRKDFYQRQATSLQVPIRLVPRFGGKGSMEPYMKFTPQTPAQGQLPL